MNEWPIHLIFITDTYPPKLVAPYWFKDLVKATEFMRKLSKVYPETPPCTVVTEMFSRNPDTHNLYITTSGVVVTDRMSNTHMSAIRIYMQAGMRGHAADIRAQHKLQLADYIKLHPM